MMINDETRSLAKRLVKSMHSKDKEEARRAYATMFGVPMSIMFPEGKLDLEKVKRHSRSATNEVDFILIKIRTKLKEMQVEGKCYKNHILQCLIDDVNSAFLNLKPNSSVNTAIEILKNLRLTFETFPIIMQNLAFDSSELSAAFSDYKDTLSIYQDTLTMHMGLLPNLPHDRGTK